MGIPLTLTLAHHHAAVVLELDELRVLHLLHGMVRVRVRVRVRVKVAARAPAP